MLKDTGSVLPALQLPINGHSQEALGLPGSGSDLGQDNPEEKYEIVAICGTAPSSRMEANDLGDDVEIWALNDCYSFLRRVNRWFEIHDREVWVADGKEHVRFLSEFPSTVYMLQHWDEIPNSVRYPFEAIRDRFNPGVDLDDPEASKHLMLGSTIDYMLALALLEGYPEIRVIGINMATATEFTHQLPSCSYWLGMARGMGVKVVLPESCTMLQVPVYGVTRRDHIDKDVLATRKSRVLAQKMQLEASLNAVHGALQMVEQLESTMNMAQLTEPDKEVNQRYSVPNLDIGKAVGDVAMAELTAKEA
jgi:hypothetical protein